MIKSPNSPQKTERPSPFHHDMAHDDNSPAAKLQKKPKPPSDHEPSQCDGRQSTPPDQPVRACRRLTYAGSHPSPPATPVTHPRLLRYRRRGSQIRDQIVIDLQIHPCTYRPPRRRRSSTNIYIHTYIHTYITYCTFPPLSKPWPVTTRHYPATSQPSEISSSEAHILSRANTMAWSLVTPANRGIGFALARHLLLSTRIPVVATARTDVAAVKKSLLHGLHVDAERLTVLQMDVTGTGGFFLVVIWLSTAAVCCGGFLLHKHFFSVFCDFHSLTSSLHRFPENEHILFAIVTQRD